MLEFIVIGVALVGVFVAGIYIGWQAYLRSDSREVIEALQRAQGVLEHAVKSSTERVKVPLWALNEARHALAGALRPVDKRADALACIKLIHNAALEAENDKEKHLGLLDAADPKETPDA